MKLLILLRTISKCREPQSYQAIHRFEAFGKNRLWADDPVSRGSPMRLQIHTSPVPPKIPSKWRDRRRLEGLFHESRQRSRHFGGISKTEAEQEVNPAKYPAILAGYAAQLSGHLSGHFVWLGGSRRCLLKFRKGASFTPFSFLSVHHLRFAKMPSRSCFPCRIA